MGKEEIARYDNVFKRYPLLSCQNDYLWSTGLNKGLFGKGWNGEWGIHMMLGEQLFHFLKSLTIPYSYPAAGYESMYARFNPFPHNDTF